MCLFLSNLSEEYVYVNERRKQKTTVGKYLPLSLSRIIFIKVNTSSGCSRQINIVPTDAWTAFTKQTTFS